MIEYKDECGVKVAGTKLIRRIHAERKRQKISSFANMVHLLLWAGLDKFRVDRKTAKELRNGTAANG